MPPDSDLVYTVELLEIIVSPPERPQDIATPDYVTGEEGLLYYDLVVGDGPVIESGDETTVEFNGWLEDGTLVASSAWRQEPLSFPLGWQRVVRGWDIGIPISLHTYNRDYLFALVLLCQFRLN